MLGGGGSLSVSSVGSWALQLEQQDGMLRNNRLSVSSVGSWALQRPVSSSVVLSFISFQYPQSDRGRCNPCYRPGGGGVPGLSVSSVGSWALQPPAPLGGYRLDIPSFSILSRIVGAATFTFLILASSALLLSVSSVGSWALQQSVLCLGCCWDTSPFSILSRIVGAATAL